MTFGSSRVASSAYQKWPTKSFLIFLYKSDRNNLFKLSNKIYIPAKNKDFANLEFENRLKEDSLPKK